MLVLQFPVLHSRMLTQRGRAFLSRLAPRDVGRELAPTTRAFGLTLWTGPVLTVDRLALALIWTAYCVIGPLHEERRYPTYYGERYSNYRRSVPYILPGLKS